MFHRVNSIPYSGGLSNSWFQLFHLLFFPEFQPFQLFHHGDSSKSVQGFTLCFQLLFLSVWSFFCFTRVLHEGFTWWFIKDFIPSRSFHRDSFLGSSSILHLAIRSAISFYRIFGGGIMSFLIIWVHVFMIHMLSRLGYFKSINLVIGAILGYISPKAFPKDCCHLWCL